MKMDSNFSSEIAASSIDADDGSIALIMPSGNFASRSVGAGVFPEHRIRVSALLRPMVVLLPLRTEMYRRKTRK